MYSNVLQTMDQAELYIIRPPDGSIEFMPPDDFFGALLNIPPRRNAFRIISNAFIVGAGYNLIDNQTVGSEALEMIQAIKDAKIPINALRNFLVRTGSGSYYVSAYRMQTPDRLTGEYLYFVIYADVTGLLFFAMTINAFLFILVGIMFVLTIFATFFLSNTITRPIKKLGMFAARIGHGDFSPSNFTFQDEEFENLKIALDNSAKQLSVYDSEQKAFFQNASHELRTPLMSIQCQAEGISIGIMEPIKASQTILQEIERLSKLVSDLLYISKIDNITTVYTTSKIDLLEIIRSCAQRQQTVADKKSIRFAFDFSESAIEYECVEELISRAIDNLISNAIRYAASVITLSCHKNADLITINISDDGSGIAPDNIPHVFERFYKGNDGNHGIGLAIVKSIVEQHQGSVTVKNTENGGAVFTVALPAQGTRK
jgi:signal transduction histidine kinase